MTAPISTDWLDLAERLIDLQEHATAEHVDPLNDAIRSALLMAGVCALDERSQRRAEAWTEIGGELHRLDTRGRVTPDTIRQEPRQ